MNKLHTGAIQRISQLVPGGRPLRTVDLYGPLCPGALQKIALACNVQINWLSQINFSVWMVPINKDGRRKRQIYA